MTCTENYTFATQANQCKVIPLDRVIAHSNTVYWREDDSFVLPIRVMVFPSVRNMEGGAAASAEKAADSASYTYWVQEASRDAVPK